MKLADIGNIWSADLSLLSKADRGRVYYERAKQVVRVALSDPKERQIAIEGHRFRRDYLAEKVGCALSSTTQNPGIRSLLINTDVTLLEEHHTSPALAKVRSINEITDFNELREVAIGLHRMTMRQAEVIAMLRKRPIQQNRNKESL